MMVRKENKYNYKHIIDNKIQDIPDDHMYSNKKDKSFFFDCLMTDLNIDKTKTFDISNGRKNLFRFFYQKMYFNTFIEFPDGGGRDITKNQTSKKIGIPFQQKTFKKMIQDYERLLVIDLYIPYKDYQKELLDFDNRVYLVIDPKEIYSSKVIPKGTNNPSSRWVTLEDILDVINNLKLPYKKNKKKNVFIVHNTQIKNFFEFVLISAYQNMLNSEFSKSVDSVIKEYDEHLKEITKLRRLFREELIQSKGKIECDWTDCKISTLELLIASHIKAVNEIKSDDSLTKELKNHEIKDINNGFLLCPIHDAIFDKHLISIENNGTLLISEAIQKDSLNLNLQKNHPIINMKEILNEKPNLTQYLKFHRKKFFEKNNYKNH